MASPQRVGLGDLSRQRRYAPIVGVDIHQADVPGVIVTGVVKSG